MNIYSNGINPNLVQKLQTKPINTNNATANVNNTQDGSKESFSDVLNKTLNTTTQTVNADQTTVEFSKHAKVRLVDRNIEISENQMQRIEKGIGQAREKGINDSLLLVDNLALIVNVKNNIVVTAVDESKNKIFTNIDGAIIV